MSDNFFINYPMCCTQSNTRLKVRSLVQTKCLDFNADRLEIEDWAPLMKALRSDRKLHTLTIKSEYSSKLRRNCVERKKPAFHKLTVMNELVESVVTCMKHSNILSTVQLQSLPLNISHIKTLAEGIKSCTSLQNLTLTGCIINNGMDLLYDSIYSHVGLQSIDLTGCGLTGQGAEMIAKLIRTQRMARYDNMWRQSLRYREPEPELFPGIRSITVNDNPNIGDFGYMAILNELNDDLWIQQIKAENCGLTSMSATRSVELLKMNDTITVLNLHRNEKIVPALQDRIKSLLKQKEVKKPKVSAVKQSNKKMLTGLIKNSNSELNLTSERDQSLTSGLNTHSTLINNVELQHTKRKLDDTKRHLMKEKERYMELKNEKEMLGEKFMKDWNKRKLIERERDRLKNELTRLQSLGNIPKPKQAKSSSAMVTLSKKGKPKKQNVDANSFGKQTDQNSKSTKSNKKTVKTVQDIHRNNKANRTEQVHHTRPTKVDKLFPHPSSSKLDPSPQLDMDFEFENDDTCYVNSNTPANKYNPKMERNRKSVKKTGKSVKKTVKKLHENNHQNSNDYEVSDAEEIDIVPTNEDKLFEISSSSKMNLSPQLETASDSDNDDTNYLHSDSQMEDDPTDDSPIPRSVRILNGLLNSISKRKMNSGSAD